MELSEYLPVRLSRVGRAEAEPWALAPASIVSTHTRRTRGSRAARLRDVVATPQGTRCQLLRPRGCAQAKRSKKSQQPLQDAIPLAMSYAKVMASLNETSAASGVAVEVKKRAPDGSYVPADGRDFATADFDAELEAAVKAVQRLPRDERLAYGKAMRAEGNAQFARGAHADAIRTYALAMAGLDLTEEREATLRSVALPLWANSAASYLALRRPRECVRCCDEALKIDGGHVKARLRRGAALLALDRYDEALACLGAIESNREAAALMRKTRAAQRRTNRMEAAYGKCLSAAMGKTRGLWEVPEAETELRQAARAAAAHDWALVVWVAFSAVVVASYVRWGEALVRYLLAVAPV